MRAKVKAAPGRDGRGGEMRAKVKAAPGGDGRGGEMRAKVKAAPGGGGGRAGEMRANLGWHLGEMGGVKVRREMRAKVRDATRGEGWGGEMIFDGTRRT